MKPKNPFSEFFKILFSPFIATFLKNNANGKGMVAGVFSELSLLRKWMIASLALLSISLISLGQTTFTLDLAANANWTTAGWVKTGTVTAAVYPGQVGGETHLVVINGAGAANQTLTLDANIIQSVSNVSINIALGRTPTLTMGSNTLTMTGNLSGNAILTMTTGVLNIGGNNTFSGTFTCGTGTVNYNGAAQSVAGLTYNNLTVSGGNTKTLAGAVSVGGTLNLTLGVLRLGANNLTLTNTTAVSGAPFSASKMIETDGTGRFIRSANAINPLFSLTYPVGSNGYYNPLIISSLPAGAAAARSISIRAVPSNLGILTNSLNKYWDIITAGISTDINTVLSFQYNAGEVVGSSLLFQPYTNTSGSWAVATGPSFPGTNPATSTGSSTISGFWTVGSPDTFYSYQTGFWDQASTWTFDPGGTTGPGTLVPGPNDKVVILTGRTVSLQANNATANLDITINNGGILDQSTFSFTTTLAALRGNGSLKLSSSNFPAATINTFVSTDGGITEYNNTGNMSATQATYYHLIIRSAGAVIQVRDISLNGNLDVKQGTFQINDGTTRKLKLLIRGDVTVDNSCAISVGTGTTNTQVSPLGITGSTTPPYLDYYENQSHRVQIFGDFTNNGTVRFSNLTNPVYDQLSSNGFATVYFQGLSDKSLNCNGRTDFYNLIVDRGNDQTFKLTINSSAYSNFRLFGANIAPGDLTNPATTSANPNLKKALWIKNGTLELQGLVAIPSLSEGAAAGPPSSDFFIPLNGALDLNSAGIIVLSTADSYTEVNAAYGLAGGSNAAYGINISGGNSGLSVLGKLQVDNGYLSTRESSGLLYWSYASGQFILNGGKVDTKQFHNPEGGNAGLVSFVQNGGNLVLRGRFTNTINYVNPVDLSNAVINTARADNSIDPAVGIGTFSLNNNVSNGFAMLGGTLSVYDVCNTTATPLAFLVNSPVSNINVTGGTVQMLPTTGTIAADADFYVNSTAPFNNLTINRASGASLVQLSTNPMTVLANLNLTSGVFQANNLNVTIGGDFTIAGGTTYTSGTNTTTLNGTGTQTFSVFAVQPLNNFTIDKPAGVAVNFAGTSGTSINVANNFRLVLGTLNDNGNIINLSGNAFNSGLHAGTGKVAFIGTVAQTIDGNGIFNNVELNNTNGAAGSSPVSLIANTTVNGVLTFTQDRLFNIGIYNLLLNSGATIVNGSASRYIQTAGNAGDGGLTKVFSSTTAFLYPVGAPTLVPVRAVKYTPATIGLTSAPTTYGSITVVPVGYEHPATTVNGQSLTYFWRVESSGFTGLAAGSITHSFVYSQTDVVGTEANYIPSFYNRTTSSWNNGALANINTGTNTITDWAASSNTIDGDFTAGDAAFGATTTYYSRASSAWNLNTTWSTDPVLRHTGAPAAGFPGINDIAIVGNGNTVNLTANASCASLQIQAGSVLDIYTWTGSVFSMVMNHPLGNGLFRLTTTRTASVNIPKLFSFPLNSDFTDFNNNHGTTEYYDIGGGVGELYILPPNVTTYGNLILTAKGGDNLVLPNNSLTNILGDLTCGGDNPNAWIAVSWNTNIAPYNSGIYNPTIEKTIHITGNLNVNTGTLIFMPENVPQHFVVDGNITVGTSGYVDVQPVVYGVPTGPPLANTISLGGNFTNNSNGAPYVRLLNSGYYCNLIFQGSNNAVISGTSPFTTVNSVTVNKGFSQATTLTCNIGGTLSTLANNWLTLQNGTFIYARTNPNSDFTISTTNPFTIPTTAGLSINLPSNTGNRNILIGNAANDNGDLLLSGKLTIINGNVYVGSTSGANNNNNDIEYTSSGASAIDIQGGKLVVNGQIRRDPSNAGGILQYSQSGASTVQINGQNSNATNAKLEILNAGSNFTMSNGTLTIVRGFGATTTPSSPFGDLYLRPETSSVTGGTIVFSQVGIAVSAPQNYFLDATVPLNNLTITGINAANPATVRLLVSPLVLNGNMLISANSFLNSNNIDITFNGNLTNTPGVLGYVAGTNLTTFNSPLTQSITGATNFYDMVVNPGTSLTLGSPSTVNHNLTLSTGNFILGNNAVNLKGDLQNDATFTDINAPGNGIILSGTALQHIAGSGSYARLTLNNAAGAEVANDISLTEDLTLATGIFDIKKNLVTLGVNSIVVSSPAATFGAAKMITSDGVFSNVGLRKFFNPGVQPLFLYPIGTAGKYTPAALKIDANISLSFVRINNINSHHPALISPANALAYYWEVQSSGLNGFSGSLVLNYQQGDVVGDEPNYLVARLMVPGTTWNIYPGVDAALNTISSTYAGQNNISGEYTAGIAASFFASVPTYTSNKDGNWTDNTIWDQTAGSFYPCPVGGPNGFIVNVNHIVTINTNNCYAYRTTINNRLEIKSPSYGHNLGTVDGNGTLYLESGSFPAGVFTSFLSCANNGTVEYGGSGTYSVIADLYDNIPNIIFSGTGTRVLPNKDLTICNLLRINGPILDNSVYNKKLTIQGIMSRLSGTFRSGTGAGAVVSFAGTAPQTIGGAALGDFTGTSAFNNLEINNSAGLRINNGGAIEINNNLFLTNGLINTSSTRQLTLTNPANNCVLPAGGSINSFIDGPLIKDISQFDSFVFPIGKSGTPNILGNKLTISNTQTGPLLWSAEYLTPNSTSASVTPPLLGVSSQEFFTVRATAGSNAIININWTPSSDVTPIITGGMSNIRLAKYNTGTSSWTQIPTFSSGNNSNGTATSTVFLTSSGSDDYTLGSITDLKPRAKLSPTGPVCGAAGIPITFTAPIIIPFNYVINYTIDGLAQVPVTITSATPPASYILPTPGTGAGPWVYKLTDFTYNVGVLPTAGVVDATTVTAYAAPTIANAGPDQPLCGVTTTFLAGNNPTSGTGLWAIVGGSGGTLITPTSNTSQFIGLNGVSYTLRWTISNGSCTSFDDVIINFTIPAAPGASPTQSFCGPKTVGDLVATPPGGYTVDWFAAASGGGALGAGIALVSGNTYYAESNGGVLCKSLTRTPVVVTINPIPVPGLTGPNSVCLNSTGNFYSTEPGKSNYVWNIVGGFFTSGGLGTDNTATVTWNTTGPQTISVNYQDVGSCTAASPTLYNVTVNANPTITLGANPSVCSGAIAANLTYSATTGTPNQYSIVYSAAALTAGFVNVTNAVLPVSPIVLVVPAAAPAAVYTGTLTVTNSVTGCVSGTYAMGVTVNANPTITLGANPSVCSGAIAANLTYSATTGTPNQYSIVYSAAALTAGFVNVTNAVLPASPIVLVVPAAAPAAVYTGTLTVTNSVTGCVSGTYAMGVTVNANPTITLGANPSVCSGAIAANLTYSATTGTPNQYSIVYSAAALTAGFVNVTNAVLPASPIVLVVPAAAPAAVYTGTLTVTNSVTGCVSGTYAMGVTVNANPTITLGANPSVCSGAIAANLTYSATTGTPNQYSIVYSAAALTAGFVNVNNAVLPASPIVLVVPAAAPAAVYTGTLTVTNSVTGCVSGTYAMGVTVNANPTITLGANPSVCSGAIAANLTYSATTGTPNQYSIVYSAAALTAGFVNVTNAVLPASPIVLVVPAAAPAAVYTGTLTVTNSVTGCVSGTYAMGVTVNANPTITLGANPSVCSGAIAANLTYSATTGTPNQYSIVYSAAALTAGFVNVTNAVLPVSPIVLVVPAAAPAAVYTGTLTVTNSVTGCVSGTYAMGVTVNANPTITLGANPSVCSGAIAANLTYSATTGTPNQYSIVYSAAALTAGFVNVTNAVLPASPIVLVVPAAAPAAVYTGTLTVTNSVTGCVSGTYAMGVTVNANPTITLGANPSVCSGAIAANLTYSATTGTPNQYSIVYSAAALTAGFVNVTNAVLPVSPIVLVVPAAAPAAVYTGTLTVTNSVTGCVSGTYAMGVTVNANPTITLGANPSVCSGAIAANLTYSATTGTPNQYSIVYSAAALTAGFVNVTNAVLPASPIVLVVPAAAPAAVYTGTLTVTNSVTGCVSGTYAMGVTVNANPTITLGANPSVCSGAIAANLTYSATTGTPNQYSIVYSAAALTAGFVNVTNAVLPVSPIVLVVPAAAPAAVYTGTLTVTNSVTGCVSGTYAMGVTVNANPTITLGANPSVCSGAIAANLTYSATTGTPNQYSIVYSAAALTAGFVNVTNAVLPASPIVLVVPAAAPAAVYTGTLTVTNSVTGCVSGTYAMGVTVNANPTITLGANPSVCSGAIAANLTYSATTGTPNQYSIVYSAAALTAGFVNVTNAVLPASPIVLVVPAAAPAAVYTGTLTVTNSVTGCVSGTYAMGVTVNANPTITLGANPSVCSGAIAANLTYSATTGTPNQYSIVYSAAALTAGFVNVTNAVLPASPIVLVVPAAAPAAVYTGTLTVTNSVTGCVSGTYAMGVTVNANPTITLGANPSVCSGAIAANLTYSATTGTPNQYSIVYSAAALTAGFVNVTNAVLPASPIVLVVPAAAPAAVYTGTLTVTNSVTGCVSGTYAMGVTVNANPTITLGANPSVCSGAIAANLTYSATTGTPNQYSIVYSAAALTAGFVNVNNAVLPASPIVLVVPAAAPAAVYTGTLTVTNSVTGCVSGTYAMGVTVNANPTITLGANPSVCSGAIAANLTYSATTGTPNQYSIVYSAAALTAGFVNVNNAVLPASPIVLVVPAAAPAAVYTGTLTVTNSVTGCVSGTYAMGVTVNANPTITLGANPSVCSGAIAANLTYSATTGTPNQYSIVYSAAALTAGFVNVTNAVLPASPIVLVVPAAAPAAVYTGTLTVTNSVTGCVSGTYAMGVTVNANPTITLGANPSVCSGAIAANLTYSATTGTPNQYSIVYSAAALTAGFVNVNNAVLPASPIVLVVPAAAPAAVYTGTLTVTNSVTGCVSGTYAMGVTVNANPTITLGANPSVCSGAIAANLTYSATTGTPNQYSIVYSAAALTAGFVNVTNAVLPVSPIVLVVPAAAPAAVYTGTLTVTNSVTGCVSGTYAMGVTVNANPTITLGANPSVCSGAIAANLTYSATTGTPNQYSIVYSAAALTAGFVNVTNAVLPASPIVLVVPAAAPAAVYTGTLTVTNSVTGCVSGTYAMGVTVNANPTITLGANPSVCSGAIAANLTYSATTGTPNQYSIVYSAAALTAGFVNVTNAVLPASPIVLVVPAAAPAAVYTGTLTVTNSVTGCVSGTYAMGVTVNANPTITLGANPSVCSGAIAANLTYSATTGTPNQYSIVYSAAALTAGFVNVTNAVLPASPIVLVVPAAAPAAVYTGTLTVTNSVTGCVSGTYAMGVTVNANPTITLGANPSVCSGAIAANLTYSATTGTPNQYSIVYSAAALTAGFVNVNNAVLPVSPIVLVVPAAAPAAVYTGTLTVTNSVTGCVSGTYAMGVTVNANPTITLGANPSVCSGAIAANLTYSATTGTPNQYSIVYSAAALTAGFVNVTNAVLPASPIVLVVPAAAPAAVYTGTLTVTNSVTGCVSGTYAMGVTVNANPTITLGANPSVCSGAIAANLTYSATTGTPNQYSIVYSAAALTAGFVNVTNAVLPASPIVLVVPAAAPAAVYTGTLTVTNSVTGCVSGTYAMGVTVNANPTITLGANPSVCSGAIAANLTYSATTGTPNQYSIVYSAAALTAGFVNVTNAVLPVSPIVLVVPAAAPAAVYTGTLTVTNSVTGCVSGTYAMGVTVNANPTITLGANPSVCSGAIAANLTYSATTGTPNQYSIVYSAAALTAGFVNVTNAVLPASPIVLVVPAAAPAAVYTGTLTVTNSVTGCVSGTYAMGVTVNANPTITLGANPSVCSGAIAANLTYSATTGTPNQYSIVYSAAALTAGFVNVTNAVLPASPIVLVVPAAAPAAVYTGTLTVTNSVTGCVSGTYAMGVTVNANPTITLGANPSVCSGAIAANLTYSATTGTPNQYSIVYSAAALTAGFVNVTNAVLPASPIVLVVPAAAPAAVYTGTLTVTNSVTGCVSGTYAMGVTVNILPSPTFTTQPGATACSNTDVTYTTQPGQSNYIWTIPGVLGNDYTITSGGTIADNTVTLKWLTAGSKTVSINYTNAFGCTAIAPTLSTATLVSAMPTVANAGPDQTGAATCGLTIVTLAGNTPVTGSGSWSIVSGIGGIITAPTSPSSTFTGTGGVTYVLRWSITNPPCAPSTDDVTITFNQNPSVANAGLDQTGPSMCGLTSTALTASTPTVGTGLWTITGGAGGTVTNPTSPTSTFTGTAGTAYVLRWTVSNPPCVDSFDDVNITFHQNPTVANAGPDQIDAATCGLTTVTLAGNNPAIGTGAWTIISGSGGSFTNASLNNTTFTGTAGTSYVLRWTISNVPCPASSDDVSITFNQNPTTANAGPDQTDATMCGVTTAALAANTPVIGTGAWSIISGLGGTITTPTSPTSNFTGAAGTAYVLRWTISNAPCTASTDDINITFNQVPTVANAGPDQTGLSTCGLTTVTLAANSPVAGTGAWTITTGAGGTVTTPTSPTSTFTGVAGTAYTLRWTISNAPCTASTDDVNITFNLAPTIADAGPDQTGAAMCSLTTATLAANTPVVGTGAWTITAGAGGTVTTPTSPTSTFTGIAGTAYTLRWTISNAPCTASTDDVNISFNQVPTVANAGPDQTGAAMCGITTTILAANTPVIGSGAWTITAGAGGTVTTPASSTSTFTGVAGTAYTLRWTISNAPCTASTDDVNITFQQAPSVADAGLDQTGAATCGLTTVTLAANTPVIGTGAWTITAGAGGTVTTPTSPTSTFTGVAGTAYTLRWTIINAPCAASTDDVNITFNQLPTVADAGPDQTGAATCGLTTVTLAGNTPTVGIGSWSIIGGLGGTIATPGSPTSIFSGIAGSTYSLRWTISNAICTASTDDVNITFNQNPTVADAGLDQTGLGMCGITITTLTGNTPLIGTGSWSIISGLGGNITAANSPTSTFTGLAGNTYVLRWTIVNPPCALSSDDVTITFNLTPTPTFTTQPGGTACAGIDVTYTTQAGQSNYIWTYSGVLGTDYSLTSGGSLTDNSVTLKWLTAGSKTVDINYSNSTGCTALTATSSTPTIVNASLPVSVTIAADANPVCAGTTVNFTATPTNGGAAPVYQWKVNGVNAGVNAATYSYIPVTGDVVTVDLTSNAVCPTGNPATSAPVTMTVNALVPVSVTIAADANPVCAGTTVNFTATPTNGGAAPVYQWKVNGVNAGVNAATYSYIPVTGDIVTVDLTSNAVCPTGNPATSAPITMTVNALLPVSVTIAADANPVCTGTTVNFTATPTNGGAAPVYQWKVNGVNAGVNAATYSYIPVTGDIVTVDLTSNAVCPTGNPATSAPVTMTVNALVPVSVTIAADANPVCAGTTVNFTATPTNGGAAPVYQWKVNGVNAGVNAATYSYIPVTGDIVTVDLTSNAVCPTGNPATSAPVTMTVNALVPVSVTIAADANPVCAGTTVNFTATPTNGGAAPVYQWKVNGVNAGINAATYSYIPVTGDIVTVDLTSNAVCPTGNPATSAPVTMTVNPSPTVTTSQVDVGCFGEATGTATAIPAGGTGVYTYSWNTIPAQPTVTATGLSAGTYTVTISDGNSCTATANAIITQPATALSGIVIAHTDVSVPGGNNGSVTVSGSGGTSPYQYKLGSGVYQVLGTFGTLTAGSYTVTVQDINLCVFDVPVTISQPAATVSGSFTQTDVACFGASTGSITAIGSGGVPPYEYSLDAITYQPSGTFGLLAAGTYTVTVRDAVLSTFGMSVTITQPASAVGGLITSQTNVLCFGSNTGSVTVAGSGGVSPYQYKLGTGSYQASGTFGTLTAGAYTVTIQDANLCTFIVNVTITQPLAVLAGSITTQTNVSCPGAADASVTVAGSGGNSPFMYKLNGGTYQASGTFSNLAGAVYTITVQDANLCTAIVSVTITEPAALSISSDVVNASCPGVSDGSITLTITGGTQPYSVRWNDGITIQDRVDFSDGTYSVDVTDRNGCTAHLDVVVGVTGSEKCIEIPTIITPNNDGVNDTWKIKNIDLFPNAEVFVFNRWGKLVFHSKNLSANEWDGTYQGRLLPTDSYHYVLHLNDGSKPRSGVISIIR